MSNDWFEKEKEVLLLDIRKRIYLSIEKFPGLHFRELQRKNRIGVGNLDYHLNYLEKTNLIKSEKSKGNKRFYIRGLDDCERNLLGILRQKNFRKIILYLLNQKNITHKEITDYLEISPSSATWYISKLVERNVLVMFEEKNRKYYQLKNQEELIKVLIAYKASFVDRLVDNFVEAFEK